MTRRTASTATAVSGADLDCRANCASPGLVVTMRILCEELVRSRGRRNAAWGLLPLDLEIPVPTLSYDDVEILGLALPKNGGATRLRETQGILWADMSGWLGEDRESWAEKIGERLRSHLKTIGLLPDGRKRTGMPRVVTAPLEIESDRRSIVRAEAERWARRNLLVVDGMPFERVRFVPSRRADSSARVTLSRSVESPGWYSRDLEGRRGFYREAWLRCLDAAGRNAALMPIAGNMRYSRKGEVRRLASGHVLQALAFAAEREGTDPDVALAAIDEAGRRHPSRRHPLHPEPIAPEPTETMKLLRPEVGDDGRYDGLHGYHFHERFVADTVMVPHVPASTLVHAASHAVPAFHGRFSETFWDGTSFYASARTIGPGLVDRWRDMVRVEDRRTASWFADGLKKDALALGTEAGEGDDAYGPFDRARRRTNSAGTPRTERGVAAIMRRYAATRIVSTGPGTFLYRVPEPKLLVTFLSQGDTRLTLSHSWRAFDGAEGVDDAWLPYAFPLHAYDEAVAFMKDVAGSGRAYPCSPPEIVDASMLSPDFAAWNLKVALCRMTMESNGRLGMLPVTSLVAATRVTRHLDLWMHDAAAADAEEPLEFAQECGRLLDDLARPDVGRFARPALIEFAQTCVARYRSPTPAAIISGEDLEALAFLG